MNKKNLKVLFLASSYPSKYKKIGGIFVKRHAEAVSEYCDVCVLTIVKNEFLEEGKTEIDIKKENGVQTIRVYYKTKKVPKFVSLVYKTFFYIKYHLTGYKYVLKNFGKPDILHVNIIYPIGLFGVFLRLIKRIPYIITEHRSYYLQEVKDSDYRKYLSRRLISRVVVFFASCVTTVSSRVMEAMIECGLKGNYEVTPNVYSNKVFYPSDRENSLTPTRFIHVSLLGEGKNVEGIIDVSNRLKRETDFRLYIIGDGPNRINLENISKKHELYGKYLIFKGEKSENELADILRKSSCLIMFSRFENFPCVIIEAFASGIPVISSNVGGISEHINPKNGILVSQGNGDELFKAMKFVISNPGKFKKKYITNYAYENFSYQVVGRQFESIYLKVLQKKYKNTSSVKAKSD